MLYCHLLCYARVALECLNTFGASYHYVLQGHTDVIKLVTIRLDIGADTPCIREQSYMFDKPHAQYHISLQITYLVANLYANAGKLYHNTTRLVSVFSNFVSLYTINMCKVFTR